MMFIVYVAQLWQVLHIGHAPAGRVIGGGVCTHSFSAPQEGRDPLDEGGAGDVTIIVVTLQLVLV